MLSLLPRVQRGLPAVLWTVLALTLGACRYEGGAGVAATGSKTGQATTTVPIGWLPTAFTIGGTTRLPGALDILTTRSGHWRLSDLGTIGDSRAYLWKLEENPDFLRIMICRRAFTVERGDRTELSLQTIPIKAVDRGRTYNWTVAVAQGSCRVVQNMEPVAPHAEWLREAVAERRLPSYRRERAWLAGLPSLLPDALRGPYDATSLGPAPGSQEPPSAIANYVGVTSSQGGEYASSRGFLHNADARVVDAALHNEDLLVAAFMSEFTQYSWYSLAQPQGAVWSQTAHTTVDPQFPQAGERAYEMVSVARPTRDDIDSLPPADGWTRDESHLENTGFVHWILTEDPVAGLVVQRQLAYHLGSFFEYQRGELGAYTIQVQQERGIYNGLSALWKARDVARRVSSVNGTVIWNSARLDKMVSEGIASIDAQTKAFPSRDLANLTGAVLSPVMGVGEWATRTGGTAYYPLESNFQGFQYGKEPLWLWTRDGNTTVAEWFRAKARQAVVRAVYIGGALGVDRAEDKAGSSLPLGPSAVNEYGVLSAAPNAFKTDKEWAAWVKAQPLTAWSTISFDNASIHTVIQMYEMLLFAKDANLGVPEIDTALSRMQTSRTWTRLYRFPGLQMHKHLAGPS